MAKLRACVHVCSSSTSVAWVPMSLSRLPPKSLLRLALCRTVTGAISNFACFATGRPRSRSTIEQRIVFGRLLSVGNGPAKTRCSFLRIDCHCDALILKRCYDSAKNARRQCAAVLAKGHRAGLRLVHCVPVSRKPHRDATFCHIPGLPNCYSASGHAQMSLGKNGCQNRGGSSPLHLLPFAERVTGSTTVKPR